VAIVPQAIGGGDRHERTDFLQVLLRSRRAIIVPAMSSPWRLTAFLLALSCAHAKAPDRPATSPEFSRFVDDYFASRFAYAPTRATRVGFPRVRRQAGRPLARPHRVAGRGSQDLPGSPVGDRSRQPVVRRRDRRPADRQRHPGGAAGADRGAQLGAQSDAVRGPAGQRGRFPDEAELRAGPERLRSVIARLSQVPGFMPRPGRT